MRRREHRKSFKSLLNSDICGSPEDTAKKYEANMTIIPTMLELLLFRFFVTIQENLRTSNLDTKNI